LAVGKPVYVLDIQVHTNVGPNDAQFICLARKYGKPCPICEHQAELKKEPDYDNDMIKSLYPKRRNVYNVFVYDNKEEEDKGVQIFEVAHFFMESKLTPLAMDARTKALIPYAHYEKGKTIQFEVTKKAYKVGEKTIQGSDFGGHKFLDRNGYSLLDPYDDGTTILDDAFTLDELIHIPEYDEVYKAYWSGIRDLPERQEEPSVGRRSRRAVEQPAAKEEVTTVAKRRRATPTAEPEVDKIAGAVGCPSGGKFGEDIDKMGEDCNKCEVYDSCALKAEELKGKVETPKEEAKAETPAVGGRVRRRPGA